MQYDTFHSISWTTMLAALVVRWRATRLWSAIASGRMGYVMEWFEDEASMRLALMEDLCEREECMRGV